MIDRRTMLLSTAAVGLAGAVPAHGRRAAVLGTVLGAGLVGQGEGVLSVLDLDDRAGEPRRIDLDFYGHGIALDPLDAARVAVFQKGGPGACTVDLRRGVVLQPIPPREGRDFYGHGAFSPDGKLLYATQRVVGERFRGVIVVRDGRTLEELGEFPSYGVNPHDCVLRDRGRTLVVTNGGGGAYDDTEPPCVTYVDVAGRRLIERVPIASPDVGAGHLALTARGDLAVVSADRFGHKTRDGVGAVSFRPVGSELRTMTDPLEVTARMRGESLSVAIHEPTGVVGVTNPFGGLVTFWDLARGRCVASLDLAYPRGIALALDGSRFVVSYGKSTRLVEVSTETLSPVPGSVRSGLDFESSHIVVHHA